MPAADNDLHTLAGAYVMDAVSPAERAEFEQHLSRCAECREEIAGFREAAARLGAAAAVRPRSALRDQVIGAAARVRQLPPSVLAQPAGLRKLLRLPVAAAAMAAAVAAAAAFAVVARGATDQLDQARHGSHMMAEVLTAPDAVILTAKVRSGGTATVVMSRGEHAAVFTAKGLAALPGGQAYELWLVGPGGDRPAGMLSVAADGMAAPTVLSGMRPRERLALTIEPVSGSARPTSGPIVMLG